MASPRRPVPKALVDVARLAAALSDRPDREEQLLRSGFAVLVDSVPSDGALFLRFDGATLTARRIDGAESSPESSPGAPIDGLPQLRAVLDGRTSRTARQGPLREELGTIAGTDWLPSGGATLIVPVAAGDEPAGLLVFHRSGDADHGPEAVRTATLGGHLIALGILATRQADAVERYREVLEERNRILIEEVETETDAGRALERCESRVMRRMVRMAKQVAITESPVLITGETGSGKEVVARAVHAWSERSAGPFVQLNCAALPENLVESELFGHRRGAFSGATEDRPGRFRVADGGTLMLDEVGDLPAATQAKLLRVLQEGHFEPVGADRSVTVDVRVIAATNVDLERAVDEGRFREDLYYRLHVFPLRVPALRERPADLPVLVDHLLERAVRRTGRGPWRVAPKTLRRMARYDWPGNVRELVNVLERARVLAPLGGELEIELDERSRSRRGRRSGKWPTLREHERIYLERVLAATAGKIYGKDGAAVLLDVPPTTLQSRLRRAGLRADAFRTAKK